MKTPMQELISKIDKQMSLFPSDYDEMTLSQRGLYDGYLNSKMWAESFLIKEKAQITNAYNDKLKALSSIYEKDGLKVTYKNGEQYYSETFV